MKLGNVTGDIYDRSIHKKLNTGKEFGSGAVHGEDCAIFPIEGKTARLVTAQAQTVYTGTDCGKYAVFAALNQAAAFGASEIKGVLLTIILPRDAGEQVLRKIVEDAQGAAQSQNVAIADVKASVTGAASEPSAAAVAVGWTAEASEEAAGGAGRDRKGTAGRDGKDTADRNGEGAADRDREGAAAGAAGQAVHSGALSGRRPTEASVVMTKWAGLEGSAILASRCREKLRERYPSYLIEEAAEFDRFLSIVPEAAAAGKSGVSLLCAAAEGGIFRALWTLAQRAGVGLEIDLKKIPIRQETVEICNYLDLNPYELMANGSLLCLAEHGENLVSELQKENIPAAVIGRACANRDRVIVNGEERRFLEPAKADEIYKVFGEKT